MSAAEYATALRAVYDRATAEDVRNGRMWYYTARGELWDLSKRYRVSLKRTAYAAAALSNNMEWGANVALLEHVLHVLTRGIGRPRGHYAPCLRKATAIIRRGEFGALRGPKVVPFAAALYGDMSAAVIDRHMWRAASGDKFTNLTDKRSADCAAALRRVARDVRKPVAEVQAVIWVVQRRGDDPSQAPIPF